MTEISQLLLALLRLGLETSVPEKENNLLSLSMEQWLELMSLAEKQGVAAIAFDGVQRLYNVYGNKIAAVSSAPAEWLQWVLENTGIMTQYEQRCHEQKRAIAELSEIWAKEGIKMMVLKGQANASFYPKPEHRATGDIDCWLFGKAEKGDSLLKELGAIVDNRWYRHSKISYKGETIENHRVMGHTRGGKKRKLMEEELKGMLDPSKLQTIDGCGKVLKPSAQFNACFLTYHGLHHFITEGLSLKQILDWAVFLEKEQQNVDWRTFDDFCKRYQLDKFAYAMSYIALDYLGVKLLKGVVAESGYAPKIIEDALYGSSSLFNSGKSDWTVRWQLVKNMLGRDRWKYEEIAQENVWVHLWQNAKGFILELDD